MILKTTVNMPMSDCLRNFPMEAGCNMPKSTQVIGRCKKRKSLLSKENIKARLKFPRQNIDIDQGFRINVLWTDESKLHYLDTRSD